MRSDLYPPSPSLSASSTEVVTSGAYKLRVALVVLALTAFALLYLGLLAVCVWLLDS